jgi:hypothetical protein
MARNDLLMPGAMLSQGQFITSQQGNYFAGIIDGQFGVYAGAPDAPIGTSITLCPSTQGVMMAEPGLATLESQTDRCPPWYSPDAGGPAFAVMPSDGNLCVYSGTDPDAQNPFVWGSLQSGGRTSGFLPFPEYQTTAVTVEASGFDEYFKWYIMNPDGSEGDGAAGENETTASVVWGKAGGSCWLRAVGRHTHDSGDNFTIGDKDVRYTCERDHNPFTSTFCSWSRTN